MTSLRTRPTAPAPHPRALMRLGRLLGAALIALGVAACGDDDGPFRIEQVTDRTAPLERIPPTSTDEFRLRLVNELPRMQFDFDLPEGWERIRATQFRDPNFHIRAAPEVETYVTVITPKRGNVRDNIARWYGQMNKNPEEVTAQVVADLPEAPFAGQPTRLVDLNGTFRTRSGKHIEGARMLAFFQEREEAFVTFKIIGPAPDVDAQQDNFMAMAASIRDAKPGRRPAPPAHAPTPAPTPRKTGLTWKVPDSWEAEATNPFVLAAFHPKAHPKARCTISKARGGVLLNVNRWRGQMGLEEIEKADLDGLPTRKVLGGDAVVLKLDGDFGGAMGVGPIDNARMLGVVLVRGAGMVFVKMLGPRDVMEQEEARFFGLCDSLAEAP